MVSTRVIKRSDHPRQKQGMRLPVLRTFKMKPGLNGVRMGRNGPDISIAKARFEGDGWKILEYDAHEGGYLQKFDGINGPIFADVWTSPRTLGIGVHSSVLWEKDRDGFNDFRRSLVEKGIISPPDPAVIGAKARLQSKRAGRRINEAHIPHVAKKIDAEAKKLEFMEGTKPKKKTRKAKPKATKAANDGK